MWISDTYISSDTDADRSWIPDEPRSPGLRGRRAGSLIHTSRLLYSLDSYAHADANRSKSTCKSATSFSNGVWFPRLKLNWCLRLVELVRTIRTEVVLMFLSIWFGDMYLVFLALRFIKKLITGLTDHLAGAASSPWQAGGQVLNLGFDTEWIFSNFSCPLYDSSLKRMVLL
jgi:hypothetical protein